MASGEEKQQAVRRKNSFFSRREDLEHLFVLSEDEKKWFTRGHGSVNKVCDDENSFKTSSETRSKTPLEVLVPRYYAALIDPEAGEKDPIRKQCIPRVQEYQSFSWETDDPLGEDRYQVSPRLIRRYTSRALFLAADCCFMYCRHCFRRRFAGKASGPASNTDIQNAALWLKRHRSVKELLISGGDPFTLPPKRLLDMLRAFLAERPDIVLRIGTRVPVVSPELFNTDVIDELAALEGGNATEPSTQTSAQFRTPIYIITQFNHPRELTEESLRAVSYCIDRGIPVLNQTVLLKGVNDTSEVLEELMNQLVSGRIIPYYLFQGDMTSGTAHFRVPLERGYALEEDLRRKLSGLAMPQFAVDLPGGGGKVPLTGSRYIRENSSEYVFRNYEREVYAYPKDLPDLTEKDSGN